jgi:galactose mutarotase-like enzyme
MSSSEILSREPESQETVVLRNGRMRAAINALGAELVSLEYDGLPLLWTADPTIWPEHAPLLFPVIGNVANGAIRLGARRYPMPQHGFAKSSRLTPSDRTEEGCAFSLHDNPETRQSYPYAFKLEVRYQLSVDGLSVTASISNQGHDVLPASFGYHPGLRWPLESGIDKSAYTIGFPDDHELTCTRPRKARLTGLKERLPLNRHSLALEESMFEHSGLLILSPKSNAVRYGAKKGRLSLSIASINCPNLTLWMRPGGDFLCIEPWHGLPEPENFDGEFTVKPGIELIPPGTSMDVGLSITVKDRDQP